MATYDAASGVFGFRPTRDARASSTIRLLRMHTSTVREVHVRAFRDAASILVLLPECPLLTVLRLRWSSLRSVQKWDVTSCC